MDLKLEINTPCEIEKQISIKAKKLRLKNNLTRKSLSSYSGVSLASIKRFETTGKIAFTNLVKIASALGRLDDFLLIFDDIEVASIADLESLEKSKSRKRGRI